MNRNIALILAGGVGSRMDLSIPKQFVVVDGLSVLQHTMLAFQHHQLISAIYVVCAPQYQDEIIKQAERVNITKFISCLNAGENSFQSAHNGISALNHLESPDTVVLIHDAVRPLISQDIISRNIAVCLEHGNAITAIHSHESYMVVEESDNNNPIKSSSCILREKLLRAQTPHTFFLKDLTTMMSEADQKGIHYSQSVYTLANELGHVPLYIAEGEMINLKLTLPSDINLFQTILHAYKD
jgi:2-C-methyl-D-erythritol 4-phosphate cytidylyltransferase